MTQEYTIASGSAPASRARSTGADGTQASAAATGNKTATLSTSTPWVAHLVALQPPLAVNGAGTLTTTTTNVSASQAGNTITFTYTAAAGGMSNGSLTLVVPSGWAAPSTTSNNAGYTTSSTGTVSAAAQTITVSSLTLAGGATATITYGATSGGGPGATATATTGAQTWQAQQKARSAGTLTNLGSSPSITVNAANGSGTLTTPTSVVSAWQTGRTITFTYTAATGGIDNGTVTLVVPSGWTTPCPERQRRLHDRQRGHRFGRESDDHRLLAHDRRRLDLHDHVWRHERRRDQCDGNGDNRRSDVAGAVEVDCRGLPCEPRFLAERHRLCRRRQGTLTTPTSVVSASQTGRTITFTYTAATGGINNGTVTLVVPAGWNAPSTTGANAGYTTASSGTVCVASQTITVCSLTIAGGSTFTITYGYTASGGPGAPPLRRRARRPGRHRRSPAPPGHSQTWAPRRDHRLCRRRHRHAHHSTSVVSASGDRPHDHLTYTAATGGINDGSVTLVVPAGWIAPRPPARTPLHDRQLRHGLRREPDDHRLLAHDRRRIDLRITYGSTASGGPGATATSSTGARPGRRRRSPPPPGHSQNWAPRRVSPSMPPTALER